MDVPRIVDVFGCSEFLWTFLGLGCSSVMWNYMSTNYSNEE